MDTAWSDLQLTRCEQVLTPGTIRLAMHATQGGQLLLAPGTDQSDLHTTHGWQVLTSSIVLPIFHTTPRMATVDDALDSATPAYNTGITSSDIGSLVALAYTGTRHGWKRLVPGTDQADSQSTRGWQNNVADGSSSVRSNYSARGVDDGRRHRSVRPAWMAWVQSVGDGHRSARQSNNASMTNVDDANTSDYRWF